MISGEAIANNPKITAVGYSLDVLLKFYPLILSRLLETGGKDVDILIARGNAVLERLGHCRCWH